MKKTKITIKVEKEKKTKKEKKNIEVYNVLILDKSGSMQSIKEATIGGFNEQVQTIKKIEGDFKKQKHYVTLVTFNNTVETVFYNESTEKLVELNESTYKPDLLTAMNDAIGHTLTRLNNEIGDKIKAGNAKVLVTIITDGMENASKEYSREVVSKMIKDLQDTGAWTITFIGANIDVTQTAKTYNIPVSNAMSFTADVASTKKMFKSRSASMVMYSAKLDAGESTLDGFFSNSNDEAAKV